MGRQQMLPFSARRTMPEPGAARRRVLRAASLLAVAALAANFSAEAALAAGNPPSADPAPQRPFAADGIWNAPLPQDAPLAVRSAAYVSELAGQVQRFGGWINSSSWSAPVYQVAAGQPGVPVAIDKAATGDPTALALQAQLSNVPIPAGAQPSPDSDHVLVIWQPATDTEWELWLARPPADGSPQWRAGWGARIANVSSNPGLPQYPFGVTASGLSVLGGQITADEIATQRIDHALALALPQTADGNRAVWPANRSDGNDSAADAIPQGTRFRLDPALNIDSLGLAPMARAIALAAQRYGIIVRDTAGAVTFYAEQPSDVGLADYAWGGGLDPAQMLAGFPWQRLQAVAPRPFSAGPTALPAAFAPAASPASRRSGPPSAWSGRRARPTRFRHRRARARHRKTGRTRAG